MQTNVLYYGDNLPILREYIPDVSVDLVYLDPPFNSNRDYNLIFKDESGRKFDAQLLAFEDTWHWGPSAEATYTYLTNTARHAGRIPSTVSTMVAALRSALGTNQMTAYLVEMAVRLVELHRVLKSTGSLYLHCDPTASHYLKLVLDAIFGPTNFRSEIIWKRTSAHNTANRYGPVHDVLLFYSKVAGQATWNPSDQPYSDAYVKSHYGNVDPVRGAYRLNDITGPGTRKGPSGGPWRGFDPTTIGRHWMRVPDDLDEMDRQGLIHWPAKGGWPSVRRFLTGGVPIQDVWTDIDPVNSQAKERLGWDTQKPLALLERLIAVSSNPGDVVLDPFCGCGTALVAAQKMGRQWVGIDITYLSIAVMRSRLLDSFALTDVAVIGQPTEVEGARRLLEGAGLEGAYQFQWWALNLVGAKPVGGVKKKGADQGVDGIITFQDHVGHMQSVIVSVKSGAANSGMVQQLRGAMERHSAALGLFISLDEPSAPMRQEAATAGVYHSELTGKDYQRVQLLSIRDLLEEHRKPDLPLFVMSPYAKAPKVKPPDDSEQQKLSLG